MIPPSNSLPVAGRAITLFIGIMFAEELPFLSAAKIALTLEVVDARLSVDPNQLVTGTGHSGCSSHCTVLSVIAVEIDLRVGGLSRSR
jgi:hypothetical protein